MGNKWIGNKGKNINKFYNKEDTQTSNNILIMKIILAYMT